MWQGLYIRKVAKEVKTLKLLEAIEGKVRNLKCLPKD